jgi:hypothetical protein
LLHAAVGADVGAAVEAVGAFVVGEAVGVAVGRNMVTVWMQDQMESSQAPAMHM